MDYSVTTFRAVSLRPPYSHPLSHLRPSRHRPAAPWRRKPIFLPLSPESHRRKNPLRHVAARVMSDAAQHLQGTPVNLFTSLTPLDLGDGPRSREHERFAPGRETRMRKLKQRSATMIAWETRLFPDYLFLAPDSIEYPARGPITHLTSGCTHACACACTCKSARI